MKDGQISEKGLSAADKMFKQLQEEGVEAVAGGTSDAFKEKEVETEEETESTDENQEETATEQEKTGDEETAEDENQEQEEELETEEETPIKEEVVPEKVEVKKGVDKTPKKIKEVFKENRELKREVTRIREEMNKGMVQQPDRIQESPIIYELPKTLQQKFEQIDKDMDEGKFPGTWEDKERFKLKLQIEEDRKQEIIRNKQIEQNNIVQTAIKKREGELEGLAEALYKLRINPTVAENPIIGPYILDNLDRDGLDVLHHLAYNPEVLAEVLALPQWKQGAKIEALGKSLKPRTVVKPNKFKPATVIKNSPINDRNSEDDEDDGVMKNIAMIRQQR
jgi:hypothetical protein